MNRESLFTELDEILDICVHPSPAFFHERHASLEVHQCPGQITFDALLSLLDAAPQQFVNEAIQHSEQRLMQNRPWTRREIASSATFQALLDSPGWPLVRNLTVSTTGDRSLLVNALASPKVSRIHGLCLVGSRIESPIAKALADSASFGALQSLEIDVCGLSEDAMPLMAQSHLLGYVKELFYPFALNWLQTRRDLCVERLCCDGSSKLIEMLDSHGPSSVNKLSLYVEGQSTIETVAALGKATELTGRLTELRLSTDIDDHCLNMLASNRHFTRLKEIDLASNRITANGLASLRSATFLPQITTLNLSLNGLGDEGWEQIANMPLFSLETLRLMGTGGGSQGLQAISNSPSLTNLRYLELNRNNVGAEGVNALVNSKSINGIEYLDLRDNPLGLIGLNSMALSKQTGSLRHLRLSNVEPRGLIALFSSPYLRNLESLFFEYVLDDYSGRLFSALSDGVVLSSMRWLAITGPVRNEDADILSRSASLTRLRRLFLMSTALGEGGVAALAQSPHLERLLQLGLDLCPIGDGGAKALASSTAMTRLCDLQVDHCQLTEEGSSALAHSDAMNGLRWLSLDKRLLKPWIEAPQLSPILKGRIKQMANSK